MNPPTPDTGHRTPDPMWRIHRRPAAPMVAFAGFLGLLMASGSAWLIQALSISPDLWLAIPIGVGLGALIPLQLWQGNAVQVDHAGTLTYLIRGRPNLRLSLAAVTAIRPVRTGVLHGIGLAIDPGQVDLLDRKGVSRAMLDAWQRDLGTAVVLEFLTPEDGRILEELRQGH